MFDSVKQFFRLVFSDQIRLRRKKGRGLKLALAPAGSVEFTESVLHRQDRARQAEDLLLQMQHELATVLDSAPTLREHARHLVQVEAALKSQGLLLLQAAPLPVLVRASRELEEAVTNWSPVALATFRSKLAVAVAERRRAGEADALPNPVPKTVTMAPSKVEVTEVDVALADAGSSEDALRAAYAAYATVGDSEAGASDAKVRVG